MTEVEERKLLKQLLTALDETTQKKWSWQAFAINAVSFCTLTVIALWMLQNPQLIDAPRVVSLLGAVFAGAMIGALSTWKLLCKNGDVVRRYIDAERVHARLAELES
ncbi:hypothetical protein FZO89_09495 [Luteimonas viscosa]|uniref:Uncharacterized protein n=1 Tax=Luteimonas viscosa TaxID=1132694 RepID=A0A5D4XRS7_9GAMM|nr:hypothetical protein [Luteimonas viscosa]TYT26471.1 hypothetical protein FZO89_09495 [Luteimonas viscosa]